MNAIETKKLTKKYKDIIAVDNLNLNVEKGELFSLLGVNGAGKTTTIKMLSGLSIPSSGDAILMGKSIVKETNEVKKIINISPQETAIARNLTVKENLYFIAGVYEIKKDEQEKRINDIIEKFNLQKFINKKSSKLSGGYQRKLSIAMALLTNPKILFLDEPTLGLDVIARRELWNVIEGLKGKVTVILTTHYMEEAEALADHIGIMKDGHLLITDTPNNLLKNTKTKNIEEAFIKIVSEVK